MGKQRFQCPECYQCFSKKIALFRHSLYCWTWDINTAMEDWSQQLWLKTRRSEQ